MSGTACDRSIILLHETAHPHPRIPTPPIQKHYREAGGDALTIGEAEGGERGWDGMGWEWMMVGGGGKEALAAQVMLRIEHLAMCEMGGA